MKKFLVLCLTLMMMAALCLPAMAADEYISPTGGTVTTNPGGEGGEGGGNDSPDSPQTGTSPLVLVVAGAAVVSIAGAAIAATKLARAK
ncbi:MAG: hypothetical protein IKV35_02155 [Clostridia bacterium]|nr:hypothetical protein [Clostridia bacterium]